jgi:protein TonB
MIRSGAWAAGTDGVPFWVAASAALALHAVVAVALFAGAREGQGHVTLGPVEIVITAPSSSSAEAGQARLTTIAPPHRNAEALHPPISTQPASAPPSHAVRGTVGHPSAVHAAGDSVVPAPLLAGEGAPHGQVAALPSGGASAGEASPGEAVPPRYRLGAAETPAPAYPTIARRRGVEGRVLVRLQVGADGHAVAATVEQTSGHDVLDRAAAETLATWRLTPAERGGRPVPATILVPIRFRLEG